MRKNIVIEFESDWQVSSGRGDGHLADSVLVRDAAGIPYLPGRAVKGALREGATRLCSLQGRNDLVIAKEEIFGSDSNEIGQNNSGLIRVSAGRLPQDLLKAFMAVDDRAARAEAVSYLTLNRSQTKLDERRQAVDRSLRSIECGIAGVSFECEVEIYCADPSREKWLEEYLRCVCAAVKSMGGDRARGLGACQVRVKGQDKVPLSLPDHYVPELQHGEGN
ncbi:MAG: hypothetical protein IJ228_14160 [Succinivibrio sp.]|nr:hypothetical protein [Succinivibrio sp.]